MSNSAISIEHLGKMYRIAHAGRRTDSFRELITNAATAPFRRFKQLGGGEVGTEEFWALKDINLEIPHGEVLGLIGRNGAGKSTLLKVLSRIVEPTEGRAVLRGRVASLLEVGTGFHPDLSGRENIYLNGSILGMKKAEIDRKFDEIVAFAEIERFLDTPVKRYSSGMYVRLAFAVAANLDPEILVVDEVLAVGDAEFQKKCIGKMRDVSRGGGRTVIFVSHNLAAVRHLCTTGAVLSGGKLLFVGEREEAIARYMAASPSRSGDADDLSRFRPSWARPIITGARMCDADGAETALLSAGSPMSIEMSFKAPPDGRWRHPHMGVTFHHEVYGTVAGVNTRMAGYTPDASLRDGGVMRLMLDRPPFMPGSYVADVWFADAESDLDTLTAYLRFRVEEADVYNSGKPPIASLGVVFLDHRWESEPAGGRGDAAPWPAAATPTSVPNISEGAA